MTNNEIIFNAVCASFTPTQLSQLAAATYSAEQRAAYATCITVSPNSTATPDEIISAHMAADSFHTFAEWKTLGYSVKKGQHAALCCQLWRYTDKPDKAAQEAGADPDRPDPRFYRTKAYLFHFLQVEKNPLSPRDTPAGPHPSKRPSPR